MLSLFDNFSVAFSYLSPMVGVYSLFVLGVGAGGPRYIWLMPIVVAGMLLVALVFGELGSHYPVAEDNPLNGNMYKPIYFDNGQAIHGALNVPRSPASKGCARLRVEHQDLLVAWLGLADQTTPTGSSSRINVTVNVQGDFVPR